MPRFSVIVPAYRVQAYLHESLDSVLSQSFEDFEIIAVDDCSPDSCGAITEGFAARGSRVGQELRRAAFRARFCPYDDGHAAGRVVRRGFLGDTTVQARGACGVPRKAAAGTRAGPCVRPPTGAVGRDLAGTQSVNRT